MMNTKKNINTKGTDLISTSLAKKTLHVSLLGFLILIFSMPVLAQGQFPSPNPDDYRNFNSGTICDPSREICNPAGSSTVQELLNKLIDFVFWLSIVIAPIMILWAAFLMVTSRGDEGQYEKAKKVILYTVIGLFFILISKGVAVVIQDILQN